MQPAVGSSVNEPDEDSEDISLDELETESSETDTDVADDEGQAAV